MNSFIIIPARVHSTRLPRKLLLTETGQSLLQHTFEAASQAKLPNEVVVAADSDEIVSVVEGFGGKAFLTDPKLPSGTDRVAVVAQELLDSTEAKGSSLSLEETIIVNVQGDEPDIPGAAIDLAIEILANDPSAQMSTLSTPIRQREKLLDPSCVKVVFNGNSDALYFSRSPIPYARNWDERLLDEDPANFYQHVGLYAYRLGFLLSLAKLPQAKIEKIESLEQLRVLHAGYRIKVGIIDQPLVGIDTPEDYEGFVKRVRDGSLS